MHYYFNDKIELIVYCVRYYKARCVTRYDAVVVRLDLRPGAARRVRREAPSRRSSDEAPMHRLWYDLRTQSMFEESLREAVHDDRPHARGDDLAGRLALRRADGPSRARDAGRRYGMLDGVFQQALLAIGTGSDTALDTLDEQVHALMPLLLGPTTPAHHG